MSNAEKERIFFMSLALAFENQVEETTANPSNNGFTGFTIVPNQVWSKFEEFNLSTGSYTLYSKLKSMCYGKKRFCFPSQAYLAKVFHCTTRTIQNWLNELTAAELLSVRHRRGRSNVYTIVDFESEQKLSTRNIPNVVLIPDVCETEFAPDAKPSSQIITTTLKNTNTCMYARDTDETLALIKLLGDNGIDIDSPRGQQYEKLYRQEEATPEQLREALRVVGLKIKECSVRNEFGLAVSSIRQQKAHIVLVQSNYDSNGNQNFGFGPIEGKCTERTEFKKNTKQSKQQENEVRQARKEKYEGFYL